MPRLPPLLVVASRRTAAPIRVSCGALCAVIAVGCSAAPRAWEPASRDLAIAEPAEADGRPPPPAPGADRAPSPTAEQSPTGFFDGLVDGIDEDTEATGSFFGSSDERAVDPPAPPPPKAAPLPAPDAMTTDPSMSEQKSAEAARRLVIYTGSVALLVPVVDTAVAAFLEKVNAEGGYLQSRNGASVTVRIPAAQFFPTLDHLRKSGIVTDEQVNAQDVTKRVFDLELRIQTAEEARRRLLKLLESATKMEDILSIEGQVRRLTEEIELMKGELRTLGDQVAFSTLTVSFFANAPAPRPYPERTRSRFDWINRIGIEQVLSDF